MTQPLGFVDSSKPSYACKLHKSLYGLKMSSRSWYKELNQSLQSLNFRPSTTDSLLLVHTIATTITIILVYVDDIILTGNNSKFYYFIIQQLYSKFAIKDLGSHYYLLGLEVVRTPTSIYLSKTKYLLDLLQKSNMMDNKPCHTPLTTSKLDSTTGAVLEDPTTHRSIVGAL